MNKDMPMDDDDLPDIVLKSLIQAEKLSKIVDQQSSVVEKKHTCHSFSIISLTSIYLFLHYNLMSQRCRDSRIPGRTIPSHTALYCSSHPMSSQHKLAASSLMHSPANASQSDAFPRVARGARDFLALREAYARAFPALPSPYHPGASIHCPASLSGMYFRIFIHYCTIL